MGTSDYSVYILTLMDPLAQDPGALDLDPEVWQAIKFIWELCLK